MRSKVRFLRRQNVPPSSTTKKHGRTATTRSYLDEFQRAVPFNAVSRENSRPWRLESWAESSRRCLRHRNNFGFLRAGWRRRQVGSGGGGLDDRTSRNDEGRCNYRLWF